MIGTVPPELDGAFYRVQPDPQFPPRLGDDRALPVLYPSRGAGYPVRAELVPGRDPGGETDPGRAQSDAWLLRLPVVRDFVVQAAILNFAHTLAVLIENGVTTAEALRLTERAVDNTKVQEILHEATDRVIEGASLCASLQRTNLIPPLFLDRLAVGEQTGHLAPSLRQIAQSYQVDLSRRLQNATRLMSGTVLFATFGFVAFLAYAIVTALFQVSASFRL